jgi:putative membrane protein
MYFTTADEQRIQAAAEQLEARTGVQVLASVIGKADHYPELPWKAFALAASLAALALAIQTSLDPPWFAPVHAAVYALAVLGIGAVAALAATLLPPLARLLIGSARRQGEVEQYARALFLERELFKTRERSGILLLISLFERQAVVLPDTGLATRLGPTALAPVLAAMAPPLRRGARGEALLAGLATLEAALLAAGLSGASGRVDELPPELIQEQGVQE